ncbi:MAG: MTAP family purine nucleoside phosphorylase [Bacteroidales bacterium]|nr:MTAP family purine nucleoside phosphorylase [Bacteroidales bacterium]
MIRIAIIAGPGYKIPDHLKRLSGSSVKTPYGEPVYEIYTGQIDRCELVYLSRSGNDKAMQNTGINCMANLYALKDLGCKVILSTSECASLQEEICPGDFVIPDQFIDLTNSRIQNIHDDNTTLRMNRANMADPFSEELRDHLTEAAIVQGITVLNKGTVITIEGYRHPTRAESNFYRKLGGDVIDMTTSHEVISAKLLGLPVAQVSLCTEYDSWHDNADENPVLHYAEMIRSGYEKIAGIIDYTMKRIREEEGAVS